MREKQRVARIGGDSRRKRGAAVFKQMTHWLSKAKYRGVSPGSQGPGLTPFAQIYIVGVCLIALGVLLQQPVSPVPDVAGLTVFFLLGGAAQLLPIRFHKDASISMSMAIALAAILVFGPAYAVWVNISSGLVHYFTLVRPKKKPFYRSAVTTAILIIAVWMAGQIYVILGGKVGAHSDPYASLPPLVVAGFVYYMIDSILVTQAMALEQRAGFWALFRLNYKWLTVNIAALTLLGFGIALVYQTIGLPGLALFWLPIVLAWYSFRLYARSVEDVHQVNAELKIAHEGMSKSNAELREASEQVRKSNEELRRANERLNIMYEVSRSLAGSIHLDETLDRMLAATRIMGFPRCFVVGPLLERHETPLNWRTTEPTYAQWLFTPPDKMTRTALAKAVVVATKEPWFLAGEPRILPLAEFGLGTGDHVTQDSEEDPIRILALLPLFMRGEPWGIIGIGSSTDVPATEMKELLIFRSMAENALEMALAHEQAERDALIDARTGLYNHRYFQEALQRELQEAAKRNSFLSFLMMDINKFKALNDVYGHLVGDQVLESVGQLLRDNVRQGDIACRYGGDEMCVLMPHTDRARAMEVASRLDEIIRAYPFWIRQETSAGTAAPQVLELRMSIGVATFPEAAATGAGLIEQADRACYRAKALGGGVAAEGAPQDASGRPVRLQVVKKPGQLP